jgi:hypothetical protein
MATLVVAMPSNFSVISHAHDKRGHGTQTFHFYIGRPLFIG